MVREGRLTLQTCALASVEVSPSDSQVSSSICTSASGFGIPLPGCLLLSSSSSLASEVRLTRASFHTLAQSTDHAFPGSLTPGEISAIVFSGLGITLAFAVTIFFCYYVYKQRDKRFSRTYYRQAPTIVHVR